MATATRMQRLSTPRLHFLLPLVLLPLVGGSLSPRADATITGRPIALTTSTAFLIQRTCVQECIWDNGLNDLLVHLTCAYPGYDGCMCRSDLLPSATNFLSSCVNSRCVGNTVDVSSAVSLWTQYCSGDDAKLFTYAPLVSITDGADFKAQRGCVQSCIWDNGYRDLNIALKCDYHWYDACLCRTDLDPIATSFLSSCVNSACSGNPTDIAAAISLRTAYCAGEKAVATGTGAGGSGGGGATPGSGGGAPTATSTSGSSADGGSSSGIPTNISVIIGAVAAALVGIAFLSAMIIMWRRRRQRPAVDQPHYWPPAPAPYTPYKEPSTSSSTHNMILLSSQPSRQPSAYSEEVGDVVAPLRPPVLSQHAQQLPLARTPSVLTNMSRGSGPAHPGVGRA